MADLVRVEGGTFNMGSDLPSARKREKPVHEVELDTFYIAKTELSQQLFEHIMGWNYSYFACEFCAVNNLSWKNAQSFILKLNTITGLKLNFPSEAQWEFAAKGGNQSKGYTFSGSDNIDEVAWNANNAQKRSRAVASLKPNELGLYDMTGNLWEFVLDDMSRVAYQHSELKNPVYSITDDSSKTTMKVIRGGGYEFSAAESEVFKRDGATSNVRMPDIGFRLAMNDDAN
ncbi:sulfatase [Alginatibacterium sediminis]|uniref:Sulfatase n=1 Tax=Alginatibacterium sediminis TaxID=2164068 RepID=A0A420EIK7_9ALTE|nr:sulfatase [Alginatibacterium sediminis]